MRIRGRAVLRNPRGENIGQITLSTKGKNKREAKKRLAELAHMHLKNIAAGFYDEDGIFHPIRASHDYSRGRAGEGKAYAKKARKRRTSIS